MQKVNSVIMISITENGNIFNNHDSVFKKNTNNKYYLSLLKYKGGYIVLTPNVYNTLPEEFKLNHKYIIYSTNETKKIIGVGNKDNCVIINTIEDLLNYKQNHNLTIVGSEDLFNIGLTIADEIILMLPNSFTKTNEVKHLVNTDSWKLKNDLKIKTSNTVFNEFLYYIKEKTTPDIELALHDDFIKMMKYTFL
jgi:hypothetical protein